MSPDNRRSNCRVLFQPSGRSGLVDAGVSIKEAGAALGVDIRGDCGARGTCGQCRVRLSEGVFEKHGIVSRRRSLSPVGDNERKFISPPEEAGGFRLACQAKILGDAAIFIPEESQTGRAIVRKAVRDINTRLNPAVRSYYLELDAATLEDNPGDWERVQRGLQKEYGLDGLAVDYRALQSLPRALRDRGWQVTARVWQGREVIQVAPGRSGTPYGLAVDLGTTTVAGYLCDLNTGRLAATVSMLNPQVMYGEDVMSRITYCLSNDGGLARLQGAVIDGLNRLIAEACAVAGINREDILDMTLVGNTCMHHIFLGIDPRCLGRAPFIPAVHHSIDVKAREIGVTGVNLAAGAYIHLLPIESGFVGADNVAVLIAEEPYKQDLVELIIDVGTNGEIVLGNRRRLLSASCATGPAFEGAEIKDGMRAAPGAIDSIVIDQETKEVHFTVIGRDGESAGEENTLARGICGSAIIDIVPQLFRAGIIDKTGRFCDNVPSPRFRAVDKQAEFVIVRASETATGKDIVIRQSDIRAIQLAKAAMYAGVKILMRKLGVDKADRIKLAGAFGNYINKESAAWLGMLPACDPESVISIGNAAGDGALMALLDTDKRREAADIARRIEHIDLTGETDFNNIFARAMWLPRTTGE
jgi:uncharacterized 2Fe-2S/4Fe-4S cluster protein (DUF4445 family)